MDAAGPLAINIERDELAFFPLLYWPVKAGATLPSDAALARMDSYMKNGGIIFFDLRDDGAGTAALSAAFRLPPMRSAACWPSSISRRWRPCRPNMC